MIVTLAEMKTYLGLSGTTYDAFLTEQLQLISDAVEAYCRRVFKEGDYVQTFYRDENETTKRLFPFHWPVTAVESIFEDSVELDDASYRVNKPTGIITRPYGAFFCAVETVVTYSAGYETVPSPVVNVVKTCVEERYNKKISGVDLNFGSDVQRISIPGAISIDFDYSLNNNDRKNTLGLLLGANLNVLDLYRNDRAIVSSDRLVYVEVAEEDP